VSHLHVHVIPRYAGDIDDPRGGVRHVIPRTAAGSPSRSTTRRRPSPPTARGVTAASCCR
jgi:diadenosine tetraphosphate (Ap4A) HIT family hydrolase